MQDDTPDPAKLLQLARQALTSSEFRKKFHEIDFWGPKRLYRSQLKFFEDGARFGQRLIRGGNQTGKTFACALEAAYHMTGLYPPWWQGRKFDRPTRGWVVGVSSELVRDGPQRQICSRKGEHGTGTVPLVALARGGKAIMVPGGTGAINTLNAGHETDGKFDGISSCTFKSFAQESEKLQSESIDWVWIDERCSEEIYSELLARTLATNGIVFMSYTPLKGGGNLTHKFLNEYSPDRSDTRITEDEARHITPEQRAAIEASLPEHERSARIHGIPQQGIARVFPIPVKTLLRQFTPEEAFNPDGPIKPWARWTVGFDFGISHPAAGVLTAWVPDLEEFWVVDSFRMEGGDAVYHVNRIAKLCRGLRIPIAWPHDGHVRDKGSGQALAKIFESNGAPMLSSHAENKGGGISILPAVDEMKTYMRSERFLVANHLGEWIEEYENYHFDEDYKIDPVKDDLISATRYAFMMRRQGKPLDACQDYPGYGGYRSPAHRMHQPQRSGGIAQGTHFDVFTGGALPGDNWDIFGGR